MTHCSVCASVLPENSPICPNCGSGSGADDGATVAMAFPTPIGDEGRFLPGSLITGRYRIIGRLGRGGMGEVYRATDLRLGQTVALKFLPEATAHDPAMLARFHNEVRMARQVTHPNVCRVYDIGEFEGQPFISMEYVDGEDLATLLRRIGRLPVDKAVEIARKLCAGLAAAHGQGVLHRDLKPANIMIDGRGQVVITDFGLAGLQSQMSGAEVRNGTPAYMAPEQLRGKEVSTRSDIYALGLVLYEIFSGRRAWEAATLMEMVRLREEGRPPSLTNLVREIDPAVERVILHCLDPDPGKRPSSALAVAAALPGGDPLAAALAAGETPSPEMVAAAGAADTMRPAVALACVGFVAAGLILYLLLAPKTSLVGRMDLDLPPDALAVEARNHIRAFGYTAPMADRARGLTYERAYYEHLKEHLPGIDWDAVANGRPHVIEFWYRESPRYLDARNVSSPGVVQPGDPPMTISGMTSIRLDMKGRMTFFEAVPPEVDATPAPSGTPDPALLFQAAGLDASTFQPATPQWTPLTTSDARAAWTGKLPEAPRHPARVEAAWWRGRPVYFNIVGPWTTPARMQDAPESRQSRADRLLWVTLTVVIFAGAGLLAWWNLRLGRGDRQGALRVGAFAFALRTSFSLLAMHHVPSAFELTLVFAALGDALTAGAELWLAYMALEPFVRRLWPHTLIGWTRFVSGRLKDPLVGRSILIGCVVAIGYVLVFVAARLMTVRMGGSPDNGPDLDPLLGLLPTGGELLNRMFDGLGSALIFFLLFFLLRVLLRRQWLAGAAFVLLFALSRGLPAQFPLVMVPANAIVYGLAVVLLLRYGLLALVSCLFLTDLIANGVFTSNFTAWYGGSSALLSLVVLAVAAYGARVAMGGRRVLAFLEAA